MIMTYNEFNKQLKAALIEWKHYAISHKYIKQMNDGKGIYAFKYDEELYIGGIELKEGEVIFHNGDYTEVNAGDIQPKYYYEIIRVAQKVLVPWKKEGE